MSIDATTIPWNFDMSQAPKDATSCLLLIDSDHEDACNPLADASGYTITIGHNNDDNVYPDEGVGWEFAGWDWSQDVYREGRGPVVAFWVLPKPPLKTDAGAETVECRTPGDPIKAEVERQIARHALTPGARVAQASWERAWHLLWRREGSRMYAADAPAYLVAMRLTDEQFEARAACVAEIVRLRDQDSGRLTQLKEELAAFETELVRIREQASARLTQTEVIESLNDAVTDGWAEMVKWTDETIADDLLAFHADATNDTVETLLPHIAAWRAQLP